MSTRLLILGMLTRAPMHGYELQRSLEVSRVDAWAEVLPGSIYHALKKMAEEGLVRVQATEQTGHRLRAVYAITDEGHISFRSMLREALKQPPRSFPTNFYAALAFHDALPRAELQVAAEALIPQLERELEQWKEGEGARSRADATPPELRLFSANARQHIEADLAMLRALRDLPTIPRGRPRGRPDSR
jgi:DNA-binding PadR family transcriptional regulator